MKKIYTLLLLSLLAKGLLFAQEPNFKTITIAKNDSVVLRLHNYTGNIQWQNSADSINWIDIDNAHTDTLLCLPLENSWYKANVYTDSCNYYISDIAKIIVIPLVIDIDGNIYGTIKKGNQVWLTENLKTTRYNDGTEIPLVTNDNAWSGLTTPAYCWYQNSITYKPKYGALYNWFVVDYASNGDKNVCPVGWHVPSSTEWNTLISNAELKGYCEAYAFLTTSFKAKISPNRSYTEVSKKSYFGAYMDSEYWWTSSESSSNIAASGYVNTRGTGLNFFVNCISYASDGFKINGNSIRCVKDNLPILASTSISNITNNTATATSKVLTEGTTTVTSRGMCWSTNPNPTINDNTTSEGSGTGSFTCFINDLIPFNTYYVRPYAISGAGTTYGTQVSFTVSTNITTIVPSIVSKYNVSSGGNISFDGDTNIVARGICLSSTSPFPTIRDNHTIDGSSAGSFTSKITSYTLGTRYYVRAYATNIDGSTAYGNQVDFIDAVPMFKIISTSDISGITCNSASSGGTKYDFNNNNRTVTARGVCWGTSQNPTIADSKTIDGSGEGNFTSIITNLIPNTTYYVRAYATDSYSTEYGEQISFKTNNFISTNSINNITKNSATVSSSICYNYGSFIITKGICWSTSQNPTTYNTKTVDGSGIGDFSGIITNLNFNTTYYVRAYAIDSLGTKYGNELIFKTNDILLNLITDSIKNITKNSASVFSKIIDDGGDQILDQGVCWSTNQNPTISDYKTSENTGIGSYLSIITNLSPNTTYYLRPYATISNGTKYGDIKTFKTFDNKPTLTTNSINNITTNTATVSSTISYDGGSAILTRGVCWGTNPNPTIADNITTESTGMVSYISNINNLIPNTIYYVKTYAINSYGTTYSAEYSFKTLDCKPKLTTNSFIISLNTATVTSNVLDDGGYDIITRGVCWGTSPNPTITDNKTSEGSGMGSFNSIINNILPNTKYYVRAYATNNCSTAYGDTLTILILSPVMDIDNNVYTTEMVGDQIWIKENLKTTKFNDGTPIPLVPNWDASQTTPAYCYYNNNEAEYKQDYGALYNWYVVDTSSNGNKNVCPIGWHVPTYSEVDYYVYVDDKRPRIQMIYGGYYWNGNFSSIKDAGYLWTSQGWDIYGVCLVATSEVNDVGTSWFNPQTQGSSIRCVKDQ